MPARGRPDDSARYAEWEANAHLPAIQERIREAVRAGKIRVIPRPGGGIRLIPSRGPRLDRDRDPG